MSSYLFRRIALPLAAIFALLSVAMAQAQLPAVYGVFFYSPTCPHCRDVINNHWPAIRDEFGDQLHVLFINVTTDEGGQVMRDAITRLRIPSNGVPMLIIGTNVLVGSVDIPARAPQIIRAGLDAGGIALPPIPGISAMYNAALEQSGQSQTGAQASNLAGETDISWTERLAADPVANGLAVVILALLTVSLVSAVRLRLKKLAPTEETRARRYQQIAIVVVSLLGMGLSLILMAGASSNPVVLMLAAGEAVIFLIVLAVTLRTPRDQRLTRGRVPLVALGGALVAAYLAYVELTLTEAVCGVVGNCNTVQQSSYARILDVPIGVIGIVGYSLILVLWFVSRRGRLQARANTLEYAMVLFGVLFSVYLTFLEPFVIGATCLWCLTSAVVMLLLLWLMTPSAAEPQPRKLGYRAAHTT